MKWTQYSIPISVALVLKVAIAPVTALSATPQSFPASWFAAQRSPFVPLKKGETEQPLLALHSFPLVPLKKRETEPLLAPLLKGGWGDQMEMQLAQSNPPPPPTNPGSSSAGGRRDPSNCPQDVGAATSPLLTALSPTAKPGFTLAQRPTFLVYVPKTSAKNAEFSLRSRMGQGVYRTIITLTSTPNLISITLPAQAMPLEVGKLYTWSFAIICNPNDRLDDRFVTGMIQRRELDATRLRQMQQASPREQAALYQQADAWYDAIAVLYQLRSQRNDPGISTAWRELLQTGGVDTMIDSNSENANPR